jgi:catechol 2,3-dioxygenase-like lactoylglutathione lyase family enzyme
VIETRIDPPLSALDASRSRLSITLHRSRFTDHAFLERRMFNLRIDNLMLFLLALALALVAGSVLAAAREIRGFVLTVSDLDRAVAFYEQALGFRKVGERTVTGRDFDYLTGIFGTRVRIARLQLGEEFVELEQYVAPAGLPIPVDSRSNDLWFQHFAVVVSDMEKAHEHVRGFGVPSISSAPQTIPESNRAAAGIKAYKFKDPDGHPLELLWFPPGKGRTKWQDKRQLFLGIDHSAITVGDTERSTGFWRDVIGLQVAGGSLNTGVTQEQLDNAFGAVVRITGLKPERDESPGLEFLQYLTPSGGRPAPIGQRPNDLVATRTVVEVDDLDGLTAKLQAAKAGFISPHPVSVPGMPWRKGLMVYDPDGHAVLLVEP